MRHALKRAIKSGALTSGLTLRGLALRGLALRGVALKALALSVIVASLTATPVLAGPFSAFYGTWSGRGHATFNGGARENLMCKGYYTGKGQSMNMALRCASPSNKIDMRVKLTGNGKTVTGNWEERTFNASGTGTGSISNTHLKLKLEGGIIGQLNVSLGTDSQLVSLKTEGGVLTAVHLKLKRR